MRAIEILQTRRRSFVEGVRSFFTPQASIYDLIPDMLPYKVNAVLSNKSELSPKEIQQVNAHGLIDAAVYLTTKALDQYPNQQRCFLERYIHDVLTTNNKRSIQDTISETLSDIPDTTAVLSTKLKQMNRSGFSLWAERFTNLAEDLHTKSPEASPVIVAYAGLTGLRSILKEYANSERELYVFIPKWIDDDNKEVCGYSIDTKVTTQRVHFLPKDFQRPDDFYLIDDTRKTGNGFKNIWQFWYTGTSVPVDESRLHALVNVNSVV